MTKNPLHARLGAALRRARRDARLTQRDIAAAATCSLPSVTAAEAGQGGSGLFVRLAALVGHELTGRSLVPSGNLGEGLTGLRKRRALSRRAVVDMAGISVSTVAAVERDDNVHFANLAAVSVALSAGLRLSPTGTLPAYWSGAAVSSAHDGWTTPQEILDKLYVVIGGDFSLDPCSPTGSRRDAPVRAQVHLTLADDGLSHDWHGRVFCNPPYGRDIGQWTSMCRSLVEHGAADLVIALLPARIDTSWWHRDVAGKADVFLLRGRLAFGDGSQAAPFASALAAWGLDERERTAMIGAFPESWHVRSSK